MYDKAEAPSSEAPAYKAKVRNGMHAVR